MIIIAVTTSNTFSSQTMAILGIRGYFKSGAAAWIDLGVLANFSADENLEDFTFEGPRTGLVVPYEVLTISAELTYAFDSNNPTDTAILGLWAGATPSAASAGGNAVSQSFASTTGRFLLVYENAQPLKDSVLVHHGLASIKRAGRSGTPGTEAAGLSFQVTALQQEGAVSPATLGAVPAPYGYIAVFPTANMDAVTSAASA